MKVLGGNEITAATADNFFLKLGLNFFVIPKKK